MPSGPTEARRPLSAQAAPQASPVTGLCVAAPWLRSFEGHFYNYTRSLYAGAGEHGLNFRVLGGVDPLPAVAATLPFAGVFRPMPSARPRGLRAVVGPVANYVRFATDLRAIERRSLTPEWLLFVETTYHNHLFAWVKWLRGFEPGVAPRVAFMLRYNYKDPERGVWRRTAPLMRLALAQVRGLTDRYAIRLVTDSRILAREYAQLSPLPVTELPIPHTPPAGDGPSPPPLDTPFRVVAPGRSMVTKGLDVLVEAIEELHATRDLTGFHFTLQDYAAAFREPEVAALIERLRTLDSPQVRIVDQSLSEREYYELLGSAHLVALPFRRSVYAASTSGGFVEALAMGKPVVVTAGTWMSAELERAGAGLTCADRSGTDLARALRAARASRESLAARAAAERPAWLAYHNPASFVTRLLGAFDG
jgi:glycosyltransferase involved in cell wall biosynthesis